LQGNNALGLNHALLNLRAIRVAPYVGATPGASIPYAGSYRAMLPALRFGR